MAHAGRAAGFRITAVLGDAEFGDSSTLRMDHFEGRSLPGWQRHAALIAVADTFLQVERQRRASRGLTLPRVRALIQEVLTAHFFVTRPHHLQRMLKLPQVSLRI